LVRAVVLRAGMRIGAERVADSDRGWLGRRVEGSGNDTGDAPP
jgi:hypothetical protein